MSKHAHILVMACVVACVPAANFLNADEIPDFDKYDAPVLRQYAKRQYEQIAKLKQQIEALKKSQKHVNASDAKSPDHGAPPVIQLLKKHAEIARGDRLKELAGLVASRKSDLLLMRKARIISEKKWSKKKYRDRMRSKKKNKYMYSTIAGKKKAIAKQKQIIKQIQALIKNLKSRQAWVRPTIKSTSTAVGQIGEYKQWVPPVYPQVDITTNRRAAIWTPGYYSQITFLYIAQIIDNQTALGSLANSDRKIWLENIDTTNLTSGSGVKMDIICHVVGTKQYKTVSGGTKTVFIFRIINDDLIKKWDTYLKVAP